MKAVAILLLVSACQSSDVSRALGAECATNKECDDVCATGAMWPDGMCTQSCKTDADCPAEAACLDPQNGMCAYRCTTDQSCAFLGIGYGCQMVPQAQEMVCLGR